MTIVNLSVLKNGRARAIRFSTLARLCRALDCQPGDLLRYHGGVAGDGQAAIAGLGWGEVSREQPEDEAREPCRDEVGG